jgi:hypothetical protein
MGLKENDHPVGSEKIIQKASANVIKRHVVNKPMFFLVFNKKKNTVRRVNPALNRRPARAECLRA